MKFSMSLYDGFYGSAVVPWTLDKRSMEHRFRKPLTKNGKPCNDSDLDVTEKGAYTPAYKEFQKTLPHQTPVLPQDLADTVEAWPTLPDSIKSAILALVKASEHVE